MESGVTQPQTNDKSKTVAEPIWKSYTFRIGVLSVVTGIVVAVFSFAAIKLNSLGNKPATVMNANVTHVKKATLKQLIPVIKFTGTLKPKGVMIAIAASSGDSVSRMLVREGDMLRAGQPIVELASYNRVKATLDYTKSYMNTINRLKTCSNILPLPPVIPSEKAKSQLVTNKKPAVKDTVCFTPVSYEQIQQLVAEIPKLEATIASLATQVESTMIRVPRPMRVLKVFPASNDAT